MRNATCMPFGVLPAAVPVGAQTEAHLYSPGANLERSELAQLEMAKRFVDVGSPPCSCSVSICVS